MPRKRAGADRDQRDEVTAHLEKLGVQIQSQSLLLEDMRSQNRATIEAVQAAQHATDLRFDQLEARLTARIEVLESVVRANSADIRQNGADIRQHSEAIRQHSEAIRQHSEAIRDLRTAVATLEGAVRDAASREALERVERRVEALEKRIA